MANEEILSDYMQKHYSDERLAWLLAHAESGQLSYWSCCCFIGIPTADHALCGYGEYCEADTHQLQPARTNADGDAAEKAFALLSDSDAERRAKLIPLIKSEMSRREALRNLTQELSDLGEVLKVTV